MKIKKWGLYLGCALQAVFAHATSTPLAVADANSTINWTPKAGQKKIDKSQSIQDLSFQSSMLIKSNRQHRTDAILAMGGSDFQFSKHTSGGLFLYKLDGSSNSLLKTPAIPATDSGSGMVTNNLYGHLLTQVMTRVFVDFAAGLRQDPLRDNWTMGLVNPKTGMPNYASKDWFASATALFNHSWKEFVFNANLSAMHSDLDRDPYALYFASIPASLQGDKARSKVSFLQENAELRYRANETFQPFIDGGLLQVVDYANLHFGAGMQNLGPASDLSLDMNGYKVGGGLSFNYKNYAVRLEQQYFQRGARNSSNLSSLSVKMSVG